MKRGMADSGPDSDAMCVTEREPLSSSTSEREFLADRAADARTAIGRNLCDMKETVTEMAGVRSCAARHPWVLTGSAVAAGVVVGAVLTRSARRRIQEARETPSGSAGEARPARRGREAPRTTKSFLFSIAGTVLAAVLQPLLQSWFAPPAAAQNESRGDAPLCRGPDGAEASESGVD